MQRITASAFKAKCLQLMDDVAATGESLIITKHGQPICQLVPIGSSRRPSMAHFTGV
jgi:prevent-host-death family protein